MDSFQKFSENKLFVRCNFFSSLKDKCIREKDYLKVINMCLNDYHDFYLKTDVLLLANVFQKFISTCLDYYGLDLCHYFSSPGLSWDAMLKMT